MKVYWATKLRGFLRHLSKNKDDVEFTEDSSRFYETNSAFAEMRYNLFMSPLLDPTGLFKTVTVEGKDCDCYGSYNKFLNADKPYFIYLENPTALYNYALGRIKYKIGREKFEKHLNDPKLRYIVCLSDACRNSFEKVNKPFPKNLKVKTIYPYVPENKRVTPETIKEKSENEYLECLFCVQGKSFVVKGGLEALSAVEKLQNDGYKINLTVITKTEDLDPYALKKIQANKRIKLIEFGLSYDELERVYEKTNVLIQPASQESFGLTILESMKSGCAVIASKLYAFPEMVENEFNGFLVEPKFWFFDKNNIPNPEVWNHRKKTIFNTKESETLINTLYEKIKELSEDREKLKKFSLNSLEKARTKFGEENILSQWKDVWETLEEK